MELKLFQLLAAHSKQRIVVIKVMQEFKDGTLTMNGGKKVTSKKQALAIAINEADNL